MWLRRGKIKISKKNNNPIQASENWNADPSEENEE